LSNAVAARRFGKILPQLLPIASTFTLAALRRIFVIPSRHANQEELHEDDFPAHRSRVRRLPDPRLTSRGPGIRRA